MKQITYAGMTFVTGTDIADALLSLVAALGDSATTASVRVPALDRDKAITTIDLVIGPSSEMVASLVDTTDDELLDPAAVSVLDSQTKSLWRPRATAATSVDSLPSGWNEPDLDDLGSSS